jgi:signal transduction histidine kinase
VLSVAACAAALARLAASPAPEWIAAAGVGAALAGLFGVSARVARSLEAAPPEAEIAVESSAPPRAAFLEKMGHELRTPLSAVIGYTEMLQEEVEEARHESYLRDLGRIHASAQSAVQVIDDLLDLSLIETGALPLSTQGFDAAALLDQVCVAVEQPLERNRNRLEVKRDPSLGEVRTDRKKVRQILLNLLRNAAKSTRQGAVRLEASVTAEQGRDWLRFVVHDDGKGLTREELAMVFEDLEAAAPEGPRSLAGAGLSMPLTRRLCEMLGGSIDVSSEPGKGTEFTVRLPAEFAPGAGSA